MRVFVGSAIAALLTFAAATPGLSKSDIFDFDMVVSKGAAMCLPNAKATATITPGTVDKLTINVSGLPKNTDFDVFIIQVPTAPFGMAWYQGDLDTTASGRGTETFVGRFSIETFVVALGVAPAPIEFGSSPFPDASSNPTTAPLQMYHVGIWFDSPADALKAGCPGTVTPFNGEHNAGIQVLNTSNFPIGAGPLINVQ
jgi:hypothetical protein